MSSIKSLINKSKDSKDEQKTEHTETPKPAEKTPPESSKPKLNFGKPKTGTVGENKPSNNDTPEPEKKNRKINFGRKKENSIPSNQPKSGNAEKQSELQPEKSDNVYFDGLASVLNDVENSEMDSISDILSENATQDAPAQKTDNAKNQNPATSIQTNTSNPPTLDDLSKFVFEEQPDESTEEIALKFSEMMDTVVNATGTDIPDQLAKTLQFMKDHPFLAETLKPEHVGTLVKTLGKSYGFVVKNQTEKSAKKQQKKQEQNVILNSLEGLQI